MQENRRQGRAVRGARALRLPATRFVLCGALLCGGPLVIGACDSVSAESIETWKTTQKGPGKLEAALKDSSVKPELRARAALAMTEIQMLDQVEAAFPAIPGAERSAVIAALVPLAQDAMAKAPSPTKAADARDVLVTARASAGPAEQKAIDEVVLANVDGELKAGRPVQGRHSLGKIVTAIGAPAAPVLVRALGGPHANFGEVAELLGKVGDDAAREQGGAALVARATSTRPMPPAMWKAIGSLGGPSATAFLKNKVEKGTEAEAADAARALQLRPDPSLLPFALGIAANPTARKGVREEMFGLVEVLGGPAAQKGLVNIIATDRDELVRYRAYEAALAVGKNDAVVPALDAFSPKASYKPEDVKDYLVKDIQKIGAGARPALAKALTSASPVTRITAVWALGELGAADDAKQLNQLTGDKGTLKGFPSGVTVGKEAARVAALLQKKPR